MQPQRTCWPAPLVPQRPQGEAPQAPKQAQVSFKEADQPHLCSLGSYEAGPQTVAQSDEVLPVCERGRTPCLLTPPKFPAAVLHKMSHEPGLRLCALCTGAAERDEGENSENEDDEELLALAFASQEPVRPQLDATQGSCSCMAQCLTVLSVNAACLASHLQPDNQICFDGAAESC